MDQARSDTNILFSKTYLNALTPLWASASAGGGGAIGPDIQVSTITTNGSGGVILDATAPVYFDKTAGQGSVIAIEENIPFNGGAPIENLSIVNDTRTYYDTLSLGELVVYGVNDSILNPAGAVGVIGQFGFSTDMEIVTTGLHTEAFYVSSINGSEYPPTSLSPDAEFSTISMSASGFIRFNSAGDSNSPINTALFFNKTSDFPQTFAQALRMTTNNLGNILPAQRVENVSLTHADDLKSPPGIYYDTLALGDLLVFGTNNLKLSTIGQVALFRQYLATTDVECVTTGFHTSSITVSSINGLPPGGGGGGPNLVVSTISVNPTGQITMIANASASTSQILFNRTPGFGSRPSELSMTTTNLKNASGAIVATQSLAVTDTIGFTGLVTYDSFAVGNLAIYGNTNPVTSTIGQLGVFETWTQGSTDIQLRTTGFHTSSMFVSSIVCNSIDSAQPLSISTINTQTIDASVIRASTFSLFNNAPVDLGGINLGLGEFLGNYTGAFAGQTLAMTLAGSALGISLVGAIVPRLEGNITPPGEISTFQTINLQTQLQFSTIGSQVSSFYRFVSSTDGLMGTVTPGFEYIVSTIIPAGTTCIRSFSDPINLANPSTFTSTVQSFGYWIPVPQQPTTPFSTVNSDFVVRSTLTAYRENISTTLNVVGLITGGNVASQGTVTAATNIVAGGTIQAGGNLNVSGVTTLTGQLIAPLVTATTVNTASINSIGINNNINIINTNYISTNYVQSGTLDAPIILTSSISLSTINGLPYNPGGPNASGIFSTLIVSSIATVSSLTVIGNTNTSTMNTNRISTSVITTNSLSATSMTFGSPLTTTTLNSAGNITNFNTGVITYPSAVISSINTNNISTSRVNAPIISTQQLFISTVNGQIYPPAFNSTIQGNLYVTSTLDAHNINSDTTILATGNITSATGDMIAINAQFNQMTSLGNITASGLLSGAIGGIGGVTLGATTLGRTLGDIYGKGLYISTITTNGASIFNGNLNVNSPGGIFTSQLFMQNGAINNLSSINNVAYPPFIPTQSTFNQVFTSSLQASTINTVSLSASGAISGVGITSFGNISTTTMNLPSISLGLAGLGEILCLKMLTTNVDVTGTTRLSTVTVSTINGFPFPPNGGVNGIFSTITVSSIATVGSIAAGGGNVGGVTYPGGGVAQGTIFAASNINASVAVTAPQGNFANLSTVNTPNGNFLNVSTGTLNLASMSSRTGPGPNDFTSIVLTNAPLVGANSGFPSNNDVRIVSSITVGSNITLGGNINLNGATPGLSDGTLAGGVNSAIFFSTSIASGNPSGTTYITPAFIQLSGAYNSGIGVDITPTSLQYVNNVANDVFANVAAGAVTVQNTLSNVTTVGGGTLSLQSGSQPIMTLGNTQIQNATSINTNLQTEQADIAQYGNFNNTYLNTKPPVPYPQGQGFAPKLYGMVATSGYSQPPNVYWTSGGSYLLGNLFIPYSLDSSCPSFYLRLGLQSNGSRAGFGPQITGLWDIMTYIETDGANSRRQAITITPVFQTNVTLSSASANGIWVFYVVPSQGGAPNNDVFNVNASWTVTQVA